MLDIQLVEVGSGGDFKLENDDIKLIDDLGNQAFLAWFGGNPNGDQWWGNDLLLSDDALKFISETEKSLEDNNLTSFGRLVIENTANKDLNYLRNLAKVNVEAEIKELDIIELNAKIETDFYNIRSAWSGEDIEEPDIIVPNPEGSLVDGDVYLFDSELLID